MSNSKTGDIFNVIAGRDAQPQQKPLKRVRRYEVLRGDGRPFARRRFHSRNKALALVRRLARMGCDAYISSCELFV